MHGYESWVAGNEEIRVVSEPLHAAIPDVSMNVVIGTGWQP
jgi:hypothetical protein